MYCSFNLLITLIGASAVAASPLANSAREVNSVKVGFGQQIQRTDSANHWVVWVEGEYACPAAQVLAQLDESPCGQNFTLAEGEWQLGGCEGDDFEPKELRQSNGIDKVHDCKGDSDKITCHDSQHDIVKRGKCT